MTIDGVERVMGTEPTYRAGEANVLPSKQQPPSCGLRQRFP